VRWSWRKYFSDTAGYQGPGFATLSKILRGKSLEVNDVLGDRSGHSSRIFMSK
jgi:hypothetical protein